MKMRFLLFAATALLVAARPACAYVEALDPSGNTVGGTMVYSKNANGVAAPTTPTNPLPASDANNASISGATTLTPGTAAPAGRMVKCAMTVAGTVTFTLAGGSTTSEYIAANPASTFFPYEVTQVGFNSPAAGTCSNLN